MAYFSPPELRLPLDHVLPVQHVDDPQVAEEARNTPFCPSQEKFHTVVLRGVRNISEAP